MLVFSSAEMTKSRGPSGRQNPGHGERPSCDAATGGSHRRPATATASCRQSSRPHRGSPLPVATPATTSARGGCRHPWGVRRRCVSPQPRRWGEKRAGRPPRGSSSRPARRSLKKRWRHLLTICRGISNRAPISSLPRPVAARSTSLARMTSRYGDVHLRARASSSRRSAAVSVMTNGLVRGRLWPSSPVKRLPNRLEICHDNTSSYL